MGDTIAMMAENWLEYVENIDNVFLRRFAVIINLIIFWILIIIFTIGELIQSIYYGIKYGIKYNIGDCFDVMNIYIKDNW